MSTAVLIVLILCVTLVVLVGLGLTAAIYTTRKAARSLDNMTVPLSQRHRF